MLRGILGKVLFVVYAVVGLIVPNSHHYFAKLDGIKPIASAVLAILLWPARPVRSQFPHQVDGLASRPQAFQPYLTSRKSIRRAQLG